MAASELAPVPHLANRQHYEVPAAFFEAVLGRHLKYSCAPLASPASRPSTRPRRPCSTSPASGPGLADGQRVLELGCGWGSLSLWMAERLPALAGHRRLQLGPAGRLRAGAGGRARPRQPRGGDRRREPLRAPAGRGFDRVVSVEMFEHMRNWPELLRRVAGWLEPDGAALRPRLRPPALRLPLRGGRRRRLDGPPLLHRRDHAGPRPRSPASAVRSRWRSAGWCPAPTTPGPPRRGWRGSTPTRTRAVAALATVLPAGRGRARQVAPLAPLLPGLRRALRLRRRRGVGGLPLPPAAALGGGREDRRHRLRRFRASSAPTSSRPRHDVVLFEADRRVGGHVHTVDVAAPGGPVAGGHRLHRLQRADLPELHPAARAARRRLPGERHELQRSGATGATSSTAATAWPPSTRSGGTCSPRGSTAWSSTCSASTGEARVLLGEGAGGRGSQAWLRATGTPRPSSRTTSCPWSARSGRRAATACGTSRPASWSASSRTTGCSSVNGPAGVAHDPRWLAHLREGDPRGLPRRRPHGLRRSRPPARRGRRPRDARRGRPRSGSNTSSSPATPTRRSGMLEDPSPLERDVLGAFPYRPNDVVLHDDERVMPRLRQPGPPGTTTSTTTTGAARASPTG